MKKIILVATLLVAGFINAQVSTSEDEYNYLTKGLDELQEKGLDDMTKKGYEFRSFFTDDVKDYIIEYRHFVNTDTKEVKAVSIKVTKKEKNDVSFYCIPINNKKLEDKFIHIFNDNTFNKESYLNRTIVLRNSIFRILGKLANSTKNL